MASYIVMWEIDIDSDTPEDAARFAHKIQKEQDSEALYFKVKNLKNNTITSVDLNEYFEEEVETVYCDCSNKMDKNVILPGQYCTNCGKPKN